MKKVFQTNIRKVYNPNLQNNQAAQESQMHAVKKIHNLLSSGAVTVTGPNQSRITKPQPKFQSSSAGVIQVVQTPSHNSQPQQFVVHQQTTQNQQPHVISSRCYVCDEPAGNNGTVLNDALTSSSSTKFPNKIGQIVGDAFMVIISVDDVLCKRCTTMINHLDRLENDIERVKQNLLNMLYRKYRLSDDSGGITSPPSKMQKLNSGNAIAARKLNDDDTITNSQPRKITIQTRDPIENQLSNLFEGHSPESAKPQHPPQQGPVQQMKIISPQIRQQQLAQEQQKKGPIKIYKCMSCDFKTTDLKQFQPHYETCKQQNGYTCKTCKRSFATLPALRQHIAEKHPTEYTCNICNLNFLNEITLKKHLEINHPEMKAVNEPVVTQLFTCNMCAFTSADKGAYEEHAKRHAKLKPFKCRLCSTRFETREQANIHAKSHQTNYFKCGSCSASFSEKEMLLKHFETHEHKEGLAVSTVNTAAGLQQKTQIQKLQPGQQQIKPQQQSITTQKLLQETIDEALRESENMDSKGGIHFFSCNICSLTFIQETYYNQHMETHKQDKKITTNNNIGTSSNNSNAVAAVSTFNNPGTSNISVNKSSSNLLTTSGNGIQTTSTINSTTISEADIESIFEKLHSDKSDNETANTTTSGTGTTVSIAPSGTAGGNENFVITSQENATGSITFNVTIPKTASDASKEDQKAQAENITVGISMPVLDQPEEDHEKSNTDETKKESQNEEVNVNKSSADNPTNKDDMSHSATTGPVSMPSLDDDTDVSTSVPASASPKQPAQTETSSATTDSANNPISEEQKPSETDESQQEQQQQQEHEQQQIQENQDNSQHQEQQHIINSDQVHMELDDIHNAESGQIKFILNENGQIIQLDNHIITTDAEGNQILVQGTDSEQIQQLLQSVGVLHSGDGLDGETLQMIQGENNQMIIVQGDEGPQLIDASLLNADGHLVIQQQGDGEIGEGAHAIGEGGVRIPVSVAYTADGQQVVTAHTGGHIEQHHEEDGHHDVDDGTHHTTGQATITTQSLTTAQSSATAGGASGETYFALEDLIQPGQKQE